VIRKKLVDRYAHQSGVKDQLVAEREVVLTYALGLLRETGKKPTFVVSERPMLEQVYFQDLEFAPFDIPTLEPIEMAAEKVRAAFQRSKVRDLYDLFLLARPSLRAELLRKLVVLKLWQVSDGFDASLFFGRLRGETYDWNDLRRLLKPTDRVEQQAIVTAIEFHFRALRDLSPLELEVVADARKGGHNAPLGAQLRAQLQAEFEGGVPDATGQPPHPR
jgi:hypothetical protein